MSRTPSRPLAVCIGCTIALLILGLWRTSAERSRREERAQRRTEVRELVAEHAREGPTPEGIGEPAPHWSSKGSPEERRYYLAPEDASRLFYSSRKIQTYDPWSYYRAKSKLSIQIEWDEHPRGSWTIATNSFGLRDAEILEQQPDLRILVTGDSHSEGFCDNHESFSNLLESSLSSARPGEVIEVINAANGGYSFYNYLGVLEKFADLDPDLFVVGVYGGNDFYDILLQYAWFARIEFTRREQTEWDAIQRGEEVSTAAMTQQFTSTLHFRDQPEKIETSLRASLRIVQEIQDICRVREIELLCLYIPPFDERNCEPCGEARRQVMEAIGLTREEVASVGEMADTFLGAVREQGVAVLDARELLADAEGPHFWSRDFHLSLHGHRAIAAGLEAWLRAGPLASWK